MKNPGYIVVTESGINGRTFHNESLVKGKVVVHFDGKKILCDPKKLTVKGFID